MIEHRLDDEPVTVRSIAERTRVPEHHVALVLEQLCGTHLRSTEIDWTVTNPIAKHALEQRMHSPERLQLSDLNHL